MIGAKVQLKNELNKHLKFFGFSYVKDLGTKSLKETVLLAYIEKLYQLHGFKIIGPRFLHET